MSKQYGQFLKKPAHVEGVSSRLSWLDVPHDYKIVMGQEVPDESLATASFLLPFKDAQLLMVKGANDKWSFVGGHRERGETLEEATSREVFEETGEKPLYMSYLGYIEINLHGEAPPSAWRYPFPTSYLSFYWGIVGGEGGTPQYVNGIKEATFLGENKALLLKNVLDIKPLYMEALKRIKAFEQAMLEASSTAL